MAGNSTVFQTQNGFLPFGQYTRNLSNKSQKIVLSDAFGNEIDKVEYFDTAPWPIAADGSGSYLQLSNTNLDNNLASSWFANSTNLYNDSFNFDNINVSIYPNPAKSLFNVYSSNKIYKIEINDISGKLIKSEIFNNNNIEMNILDLSNGIYLIKVFNESGVKNLKIIKN